MKNDMLSSQQITMNIKPEAKWSLDKMLPSILSTRKTDLFLCKYKTLFKMCH